MPRITLKFLLAAIVVAAVSGCSMLPGENRLDQLTVSDAWGRPAKSGDNGAVYFVIDNGANLDDQLLRAETEVAGAAEIHLSTMDANGIMRMRPQESIPLPSGGQVELKPGGLHLMLVGLTQDLNPGDQFHVTLWFQAAGKVTVDVQVKTQ